MKKTLLLFIIVSALVFAVSCGSSGVQDGEYSAQTTQDEYGWSDTLTVTYSGGELSQVTFESINEEGTKKSTLSADEYPMDPPPSEWIPQMTENIKMSEGDPEAIEVIAGASISSENAKTMLSAINENANEGNTDTALVEAAQ